MQCWWPKAEDGMGSSATNSRLHMPHGCYILPWPGTGSAATNAESWNTKSIFTLCFVVRIILQPYQFEMLLDWGCWGHRTAANSNSVYCFCGLGMHSHSALWCESLNCCLLVSITTTVFAFVCKIWNTDIYHCSCFLLLNLIFIKTNNILTLVITHYTFHRNRQRNGNQLLLLTIFLSHIMTHK